MSFAPETEKLAKELIQAEYKNACEQFGEKYHSLHEGYAVWYEELEEVENEIKKFDYYQKLIWSYVKCNGNLDNGIPFEKALSLTLKTCENAIKELAQVGAVLMKIRNTISPVEKSENLEKTPKLVWHDYPNETPKHEQKVLIKDRYGNIYTAFYYTDKNDTCFSVQSLTYGLQGCEFIANEQVKKWCDFPLEVEE